MNHHKYYIFLLLILIPFLVFSQRTATVTVKNAKTNDPIEGVTVSIDKHSFTSDETNSEGLVNFEIPIQGDEKILIRYWKEGYYNFGDESKNMSYDKPTLNSYTVFLHPIPEEKYLLRGRVSDYDDKNVSQAIVKLKIGQNIFQESITSGYYLFELEADEIEADTIMTFEILKSGCQLHREEWNIPINQKSIELDMKYSCSGELPNPNQKSFDIRKIVDNETREPLENVSVNLMSFDRMVLSKYPNLYHSDMSTSIIEIKKEGYEPISLDLENIQLTKKKSWLKRNAPILTASMMGLAVIFKHYSTKNYEKHLDFSQSDADRKMYNDTAKNLELAGNITFGLGIVSGIIWAIPIK